MFSAVFSLFLDLFLDRFFQCPVKYILWILSMEIVLLVFFFIYIFIRKIAYRSIEQLISWYSGNTPVATYPDATLLAAVTILPSVDMSVASMVTLPITNIETVTIPTVNGTFNFTIVALLCPVTAETVWFAQVMDRDRDDVGEGSEGVLIGIACLILVSRR